MFVYKNYGNGVAESSFVIKELAQAQFPDGRLAGIRSQIGTDACVKEE
jgi:hypothetical protein